MEAIVVLLLVLCTWSIGWVVDWAIVRFIVIPSVYALWGVSWPFWPVMGLFLVISMLLGSGIRTASQKN